MKGRTPIRLGAGELSSTHPLFSTERYAAWPHYLLAAARIEPAVITSLLSDEGFDAFTQTQTNRETWVHKPEWSNLPVAPGPDNPLNRFIDAWCEKWGMHSHFARIPAHNLLADARWCRTNGEPEPPTFTCDCAGVPFDPRAWRHLHGASFSTMMRDPATGREVQISGIGSGERLNIDLPGLTWNPGEELLSSALTRIMATIQSIVASDLDRVRDEYIADGYRPIFSKRASEHFEWMARYQILGESRGEISKFLANVRLEREPDWEQDYDPAFYKSHVGKAIKQIADLLGLRLRDP